jgi:hypothetical protein
MVATRIFPSANFLGPEAYHLLRLRQQEVIHSPTLADRVFEAPLVERLDAG